METKKKKGMKCKLCRMPVSIFHIHSARPFEKGLCCRWCWGTMVIPARVILAEVDSPVEKKFLLEDMKKCNEKKIMAGLKAREKIY